MHCNGLLFSPEDLSSSDRAGGREPASATPGRHGAMRGDSADWIEAGTRKAGLIANAPRARLAPPPVA